jgi:hypothetical protein
VPIGRQLAELEGSDTVVGDVFASSVTVSGTTAEFAGRAYVFEA